MLNLAAFARRTEGGLTGLAAVNDRLLVVPNWSVGRERQLVRQMRDLLESSDVVLHYCEADIDHNRTVTAFSGPMIKVLEALGGLCELVMPVVNLQRHVGVHPRIGALDVCPMIPVPGGWSESELVDLSHGVGEWVATRFEVPVFMYEQSTFPGHIHDLPSLRRGGFGGLMDCELDPDFGPKHVHPHMGATVLGVRGFLIAMNVNLLSTDRAVCERIAFDIRKRRRAKEPLFKGVRALGFPLASRDLTQVSLNLTEPDVTSPDEVIEWVTKAAREYGVEVSYNELIGVVRSVDMGRCTLLAPRAEQVVSW